MVYNTENFAKIKNRADQCELLSKLQSIDREKKNEMRMLKTEIIRFQYKCSRLSLRSSRSLPIEKFSEDVIGVNPSTKFPHRTESQKSNREPQMTKSMDYVSIHDLVFTDDVVDVEKILCLHLLSAHRTETLAPANRTLRYLCKGHSPAERLIERSKRGFTNHEKISRLLPLYAIELVETGAMGEQALPLMIKDGRLAARILLNQEIRLLINTVIDALEISNPHKLQDLLRIGKDPSLLEELLTKSKVDNFMEDLYNHPIMNCESFVLTPPFIFKSTELVVKTKTGKIESLVKSFRDSVLQIPERFSVSESVETKMESKEEQKPPNNAGDKVNVGKKVTPTLRNSAMEYAISAEKNDKVVKNPHKFGNEEERKPARHIRQNFILKNIEAAANTKKIEYDTDDALSGTTSSSSMRRTSTSSNSRKSWENRSKVQVINYNVSTPAIEEENEEKNGNSTVEKIVTARVSVNSKHRADSLAKKAGENNEKPKHYIKLTTCPACMERWKTPLPSPKTPRIKRASVVSNDFEKNPLKTNSINRINALIDKELYKLESYDRRYSTDNQPFRRSTISKQDAMSDSMEYIKMTPLELAKIQQEIKEKETQMKLEKFLSTI